MHHLFDGNSGYSQEAILKTRTNPLVWEFVRGEVVKLLRGSLYNAEAADALATLPLELWEATNSFGDQFSVLYMKLPVDRFIKLAREAGGDMGQRKYSAISDAMQAKGERVRFIGMDYADDGGSDVSSPDHKVSEEFLKQEPQFTSDPAPVPESTLFGIATEGVPRAFISYSWEGPEHQEWVSRLATRLQGDGIEIIFDRWHLHPGQEKQHFMEQAVTKSDFVVVICTENYATRANNREGGVGYESMIITSEMADHILTRKFIPVLRSGGFKISLPHYIKGRMGVDLSGTPYREDEYERLIRVLHGESIQPPPIGKKPTFAKGSTPEMDVDTGPPSVTSATPGPSSAGFILGPPNKRPSALAHAEYDKPGLAEPWVRAYARLWDNNGKQEYSFETSRGDEFLGTKDEVISRFFEFNRGLLKEGYMRMGFTPGPDPDFRVLS